MCQQVYYANIRARPAFQRWKAPLEMCQLIIIKNNMCEKRII